MSDGHCLPVFTLNNASLTNVTLSFIGAGEDANATGNSDGSDANLLARGIVESVDGLLVTDYAPKSRW